MKVRTRFIKSVIDTARTSESEMPWTRGSVRRESIKRRNAAKATPRVRSA